jgi:hypothetical protein
MGGGDSAPQAYQPAFQSGADRGYYGTLKGLTQQDTATQATANAGYNAAYQGVVNNPFDASMVQGITDAANNSNTVAAGDLSAAGTMAGQANQGYADANAARSMVPGINADALGVLAQAPGMSANAGNMDALAGKVTGDANTVAGYAPQYQALAALAAGYAIPSTMDAQTLRSYAPSLMESGFDPNMSTYNYGLKQTQDTQNVANAESGTAGSPFGAGATGDAMATYQRNYEAAQQSKQMQALSALASLYSSAGGLDANALAALAQSGAFTTAGAGDLSTAAGMNSTAAGINSSAAGVRGNVASLYPMASGINLQALAALAGAGGMDTNAAGLAGKASDLAHSGVETQATAAQLPYAAINQEQQDRMSALDEMTRGAATASGSVRGDVKGYGDYLSIGQGATALDQQAAQINNQNSFLGQLGQLVGVLGSAAIKAYAG